MLPVVVAAFAYPAGNRMTMDLAGDGLDVWHRLLAMTIASLPFWVVLAIIGVAHAGVPSGDQLAQSAIVVVCAGIVATALFFSATNRVRNNPGRLAAVEGTQGAEIVFALCLEMATRQSSLPSPVAWVGIAVIAAGLVLYVVGDRRG